MNKVFSATAIEVAMAMTTASFASSVEGPKDDGGGAMMHEKLIIVFGLDSYFAWHDKVRMIETSKDAGFVDFKQVFVGHYEVEFDQWMSDSFAPYVAHSYVHYTEFFKSTGSL